MVQETGGGLLICRRSLYLGIGGGRWNEVSYMRIPPKNLQTPSVVVVVVMVMVVLLLLL